MLFARAGTPELIELCKYYEAKEFAFKNWSCEIIFVVENFYFVAGRVNKTPR